MRNRSTIPTIIFVTRSFAFFASPKAPLIDISIPEYTSIRTQISATINVAYLMIPPSISITLQNHHLTVHLYLRHEGESAGVQFGKVASGHFIPGIFSVTITSVSQVSAKTIPQNMGTRATNNNKKRRIFFIFGIKYR